MDDFDDGVQPENDLSERDYNPNRKLRLIALVLLACLLLPTILYVIEITTGWVSHAVQPILPVLHKVWAF